MTTTETNAKLMNHAASNTAEQQKFKYIKELTTSEKREFLASFDTVFCDCDGVIWQTLRDAIPGAAEAIDYLRRQGKQVTFVTNNSITATAEQIRKFQHCNIQVNERDIVHPAQNVCDYLKSINFDGLVYCISLTPFKQLLRAAGFKVVEEENRIITESVHDLRAAIYNDDPVRAVVIDVDFNLTAAKLMRAHVHLKHPECILIGGAADTLIPFGGGDIIGPGPFISVVEQSTKRKAIVLGKPGNELKEMLWQRYHCKMAPKRALFIGDSLTSDIKFGKECGFQTLLVLTGGTKQDDLQAHNLNACEMPDYVATSLADLM